MFCSNCGAEAMQGASFCAKCGRPLQSDLSPRAFSTSQGRHRDDAHVSTYESSDAEAGNEGDNRWFLIKLAAGSYGLAKTFWLFGILVWAAYIVAEGMFLASKDMANRDAAIAIGLAFIAYLFFIIPGIWNAADKYQGPKLLAVLSKFVPVLWLIQLAGAVVQLVQLAYVQ